MSEADCRFIYEEWHARAQARDVEALLALYAPHAVLESPLVPAILDQSEGVLRGHEQIRRFLAAGTARRPNDLVRWWRSREFLTNGRLLFWEYPRALPDGAQIDIAEVMEIEGRQIVRHRIYWGWFGLAELARSAARKD